MRAVAIRPGEPDSLHLRDVPRPALDEVADGAGVRIQVLQVGLCATDRDLLEGHYGATPPGADHLVIGHECLGQVTEAGPGATSATPATSEAPGLRPGQLVVPTIRRPGGSPYDQAGRQDLSTDAHLIERGISLRHGYLTEEVVEGHTELVRVPDALARVAVLTEPLACVRKGLRQADAIGARLGLWEPHRALVLGAGPIGLLAALELRLRGHAVTCVARTPAPTRSSELVERIGGRYVSAADGDLHDVTARHGPFDLVVEATGAPALLFPATHALAPNGILLLLSVTSGSRHVDVDAARFNQALVLRNRVLVGSVAAAREDFEAAVALLAQAEATPGLQGWLSSLTTTRIAGFDLSAIGSALQDGAGIKTVVEIAPPTV